jgi:hypothetical protein
VICSGTSTEDEDTHFLSCEFLELFEIVFLLEVSQLLQQVSVASQTRQQSTVNYYVVDFS